jgi:hypothetical protein
MPINKGAAIVVKAGHESEVLMSILVGILMGNVTHRSGSPAYTDH